MKRYEKFLILFIVLFSVYGLGIYVNGIDQLTSSTQGIIYLCSPIIAIILFGIYALTVIMTNVFKLRNYPDEYTSMVKDIDEAHNMLQKKGFKFE
ncbi:hypothetical protein WA158_005948 [Blastocystis sp. Blastoise]